MKKNYFLISTILLFCISAFLGYYHLSKNAEIAAIKTKLADVQLDKIMLEHKINNLTSELNARVEQINLLDHQLAEIKKRESLREIRGKRYKVLKDLQVYQSQSVTSNIIGEIPRNSILMLSNYDEFNLKWDVTSFGGIVQWLPINYDGLSGFIIAEEESSSSSSSFNRGRGLKQNLLLIK